MAGYVLKPFGSDVAVEFDWRDGYLRGTELVSADLGWSIVRNDDGADALTIVEQQSDLRRSRAVFRGGVPGRFYLVSSRIRTSRARELDRAAVLRIALGRAPALRSFR